VGVIVHGLTDEERRVNLCRRRDLRHEQTSSASTICRDNMKYKPRADDAAGAHHYAIVDEVDFHPGRRSGALPLNHFRPDGKINPSFISQSRCADPEP